MASLLPLPAEDDDEEEEEEEEEEDEEEEEEDEADAAGAGCGLLAAARITAKGEPSAGALVASFALVFAEVAAGADAGAAIALVEMAAKQKTRIEPIPTKQRPDQFFRGGIPGIFG